MPTLQEATSHIDARIDKWYREQLRAEKTKAKDMLLRYRTQISESLQQVRELTENDLGQGPLSALLGGNTERLNIDASFAPLRLMTWNLRCGKTLTRMNREYFSEFDVLPT